MTYSSSTQSNDAIFCDALNVEYIVQKAFVIYPGFVKIWENTGHFTWRRKYDLLSSVILYRHKGSAIRLLKSSRGINVTRMRQMFTLCLHCLPCFLTMVHANQLAEYTK
jgi:hypothetical protein